MKFKLVTSEYWRRRDGGKNRFMLSCLTILSWLKRKRNGSRNSVEGGFAVNSQTKLPGSELIEFRAMRLDDIQQICQIEKEAFPTPWSAGAFRNELLHNRYARYTVMDKDGLVVGYGGMWLITDEAHVTNVAIRKPFRGMRLGEKLLTEMKRTAVAQGARFMTLEVRPSNQIARNLYEKMGFNVTGVRKGYYTDNQEDALIMTVKLQ